MWAVGSGRASHLLIIPLRTVPELIHAQILTVIAAIKQKISGKSPATWQVWGSESVGSRSSLITLRWLPETQARGMEWALLSPVQQGVLDSRRLRKIRPNHGYVGSGCKILQWG